jgi:hypothetical protein
MAVPVVRWIGERIKATGTICAGIAAAGAAGEASTACNSGVVPGKKKKMQNN